MQVYRKLFTCFYFGLKIGKPLERAQRIRGSSRGRWCWHSRSRRRQRRRRSSIGGPPRRPRWGRWPQWRGRPPRYIRCPRRSARSKKWSNLTRHFINKKPKAYLELLRITLTEVSGGAADEGDVVGGITATAVSVGLAGPGNALPLLTLLFALLQQMANQLAAAVAGDALRSSRLAGGVIRAGGRGW